MHKIACEAHCSGTLIAPSTSISIEFNINRSGLFCRNDKGVHVDVLFSG